MPNGDELKELLIQKRDGTFVTIPLVAHGEHELMADIVRRSAEAQGLGDEIDKDGKICLTIKVESREDAEQMDKRLKTLFPGQKTGILELEQTENGEREVEGEV